MGDGAKKINLIQNGIICGVLFMLSMILLNFNNIIKFLSMIIKSNNLGILNIMGTILLLLSFIIIIFSIYEKRKETSDNKYIVMLIIIPIIFLYLVFRYKKEVCETIIFFIFFIIIMYTLNKLYKIDKLEFVDQFYDPMAILLINVHLILIIFIGYFNNRSLLIIIVSTIIFILLLKVYSKKYNNNGLLKTLGICILFLIAPYVLFAISTYVMPINLFIRLLINMSLSISSTLNLTNVNFKNIDFNVLNVYNGTCILGIFYKNYKIFI